MSDRSGVDLDGAVAAAFLASCPDAFIGVDTDFRVVAWNQAAEELFGWSADEVLGRVPPHLDPAQEASQRAAVPGAALEAVGSIQHRWHRDGHVVHVVVEQVTPLRGSGGEVIGWGRLLRRATAEDLAKAALPGGPAAGLLRGEDGRVHVADLQARVEILETSAAVTAGAGLDLDDVLEVVCQRSAVALAGSRAGVYLPTPDGRLHLARLWGAEATGDDGGAGVTAVLDPHRPRLLHDELAFAELDGPWGRQAGARAVAVAPLRVGDADVGALVVARTGADGSRFDGRARLVLEAIARQAALAIWHARLFARERTTVRRLEELDERKDDYVAGLSHDLRSPLASMLAFVQTMRRVDATSTSDERLEYLDIMERQVTRLIGLVDDILLGARLEAGRLAPDEHERFDLGELVGALLATLAPAHRARVRHDHAGTVAVCGDRRQLERVVQNLVDNALVHTPASTAATVRVFTDGDEAVLRVHDDGPGLPPEARDALFTRYGRGSRPRAGSTGLGLYTSRGIVESHGGRIGVSSDGTRGTTFEVRLPAAD